MPRAISRRQPLSLRKVNRFVLRKHHLAPRRARAVLDEVVRDLIGLHATLDFSLQLPAVAILYACIMGVACAQSYSSVEHR